MIKIRRGCFETNSSSTHAICIPKEAKLGHDYKLTFRVGCYGWDRGNVDANDYLYTAICDHYSGDEKKRYEVLNKIKSICETHNIECKFIEPKWETWKGNQYLDSDDGYIDHGDDLSTLLDMLFSDDELLTRYLAGAEVFTGNDNSDDERIDDVVEEYELKDYYVYEKGN